MFTEDHKIDLENQVMEYLGSNLANSNLSTKDDVREQLNELLEQTNYSGAQSTLTEVNTMFNIYKQFAKEVPIESSITGE